MYYLEQAPGRTAFAGGKEYLFFSGYNYLGMNGVSEFMLLLEEGVRKFGWIFPSARISNTRFLIYEECEALLSLITGSETTVLYPSGFTAGKASISIAEGRILNAPASHPAIVEGNRAVSQSGNWSADFKHYIAAFDPQVTVGIAADSVNPLNASIQDFSFLKTIGRPVLCIVDDSHGIGIIGREGCGAISVVPHNPHVGYVFTYSLSKAYGISGGAVSCSKAQGEYLRSRPDYGASTALLPAQAYAFVKGQHLYSAQRERLAENIRYFSSLIKDLGGIRYHKDLPVFILPADLDEQSLSSWGIIISSFAYPDPSGEKFNRVVINALHTRQDLEYLSECLYKILL